MGLLSKEPSTQARPLCLCHFVLRTCRKLSAIRYKDLATDEFWVRGHAPHAPAMPAVLMCEAAAQLASYYALAHKLYPSQGGFLGLKNVRCRRIEKPGERLFVMAKLLKIRGAVLTCQFQCAVRNRLVCDGILIGSVFPSSKGSGASK